MRTYSNAPRRNALWVRSAATPSLRLIHNPPPRYGMYFARELDVFLEIDKLEKIYLCVHILLQMLFFI
jgi:hypothetical protein